jgi:DNA-binding transcriptional LysR family regulator
MNGLMGLDQRRAPGRQSRGVSEETVAGSLAPKLALLRALAEEGNLTRAAARLGVPQSTASRWLAMVSTELGTAVVVPDGRGIRLTRAGAYLAEEAGRALSVLAAGVRQAVDEGDPEHGHVVLAFMQTLGEHLVPGLLGTFRRRHPHVRFSLMEGPHEELLDHVRSGRADLAFTAPLPGPGEFAALTLEEQQLVVTVPTEHRLAGRARMRMADLAREPSVGMKPGYGLRQITDELAEAAGFRPMLAFEGDDVDTLRGLIAAGLGVAILPAAEPSPRRGTVEIPLRPKATRRVGLIWPADRPLAPAALAFRDFVRSGT